jgi:hypothetical protein
MSLPVDISCRGMKISSALLFFSAWLTGCANPGPPRPPSLHLPTIVSDLSAERSGNEVKLRWTTPSKTTDGISVVGPLTAEVCRASSPSGAAAACSPVRSVPVKPGPSEASEVLPAALHTDPQVLLAYRVSILNSQQRSAGLSQPAYAAAGSAPPAITGLHIEAAEQGAMLQWEQKDAADAIELDRLHVVAAATGSHQPGTFPSAGKEPTETRFRVARAGAGSSPFRSDAGGSVDATARRGETYTYTAQRVREVTRNGHVLEIRSIPSFVVTVVMRDSFPPKAPAGLEAILAGPATASPAIDLSWRPGTEPDLAGYLVYRQELGTDGAILGARLKLTSAPIPEPGFRDTSVVAGRIYSYSLTAVDSSGNESSPGAAAREEVR